MDLSRDATNSEGETGVLRGVRIGARLHQLDWVCAVTSVVVVMAGPVQPLRTQPSARAADRLTAAAAAA